jgi:hypothetical protein
MAGCDLVPCWSNIPVLARDLRISWCCCCCRRCTAAATAGKGRWRFKQPLLLVSNLDSFVFVLFPASCCCFQCEGKGRWRFKIPVLVSDLDVQCALWLKLRLAPMCPWIGTISLAFVGPPAVKVQLSPYNRVRLMRIPVLQVGAGCLLLAVVRSQSERSLFSG